jgi:hypothetical protein
MQPDNKLSFALSNSTEANAMGSLVCMSFTVAVTSPALLAEIPKNVEIKMTNRKYLLIDIKN